MRVKEQVTALGKEYLRYKQNGENTCLMEIPEASSASRGEPYQNGIFWIISIGNIFKLHLSILTSFHSLMMVDVEYVRRQHLYEPLSHEMICLYITLFCVHLDKVFEKIGLRFVPCFLAL